MANFLVNMGDSLKEQVMAGILFAPATEKTGRAHYAFSYAADLRPGDKLYINSSGICYVGTVKTMPIANSPRPYLGKEGRRWVESGWLALVDYVPVAKTIQLGDHSDVLVPLGAYYRGPVNRLGHAKQKQYISVLTPDFRTALDALLNGGAGWDPELDSFVAGLREPVVVARTVKQRQRNRAEAQKAKERAKWVCERCELHFRWGLQGAHLLAHKNLKSHDAAYNIAALCPNCHAEYDAETPERRAEIRREIYDRVPYLARYRHLSDGLTF